MLRQCFQHSLNDIQRILPVTKFNYWAPAKLASLFTAAQSGTIAVQENGT
jgi:hypothetical protein